MSHVDFNGYVALSNLRVKPPPPPRAKNVYYYKRSRSVFEQTKQIIRGSMQITPVMISSL